jgi:sugar lactone lactonase YvrE
MHPVRCLFLIAVFGWTVTAQTYLLTTIAGNTGGIGDGGPAEGASFESIRALALDMAGSIYIADGSRVRVIGRNGIISTIVGLGSAGSDGDGIAARLATTTPNSVAVDRSGNLYIAETLAPIVRRVTPDGIITTVAGTGVPGFSGDGGPAVAAQLSNPVSVAADGANNIYISDSIRIRKITQDGVIMTVATFSSPTGGLAVDMTGNVYVSLSFGEVARLNPDGSVETLIGPNSQLQPQVPPSFITVDSSGTLFVADGANNRIIQVDPEGHSSVYLQVARPGPLAADGSGGFFIAQGLTLARVSKSGSVAILAGAGVGDGAPAPEARFQALGMALDSNGEIYVADTDNYRIRKIDRAGIVTTIAGTGAPGFSGDRGPAANATLNRPYGVRVDHLGNVFIADTENHRVRKVDTKGVITTVAVTALPAIPVMECRL